MRNIESDFWATFRQAKGKYPNHLLLYQTNDAYAALFEDAERAAEILNLPLVHAASVPVLLIPAADHNQYMPHLIRLLAEGISVVVCDPEEACR